MPALLHEHVLAFGGLYTSVSITDKFNAKTYKGLPNYIVVAGPTKLAVGEVEGIVTSSTSASFSSSTLNTTTLKGAGLGVTGVITAFRLSGKMNSELRYTATVEGAQTTGATSTTQPGTVLFLEDAELNVGVLGTVVDFELSLTWDVEFVYDKSASSYPYPDLSKSFLKGFEGTLTATILGSNDFVGSTLSSTTFSISAGGLSISGTGYITECTPSDEVDSILGTKVTLLITALT